MIRALRPASGGWLADDPGKAWAERYYLLYSPVWMAAVALVMLGDVMAGWGDGAYLAFGIAVALPIWLGPALARGRPDRALPLHATYWFRFAVFTGIMVLVGTFFYTHYFFEVMGMRYAFPTRWTLDAVGLRRGEERVPLFLYPLTHAYFVTYYTAMVVALRRARRLLGSGALGTALAVAALAYAVAFAETLAMATGPLERWFGYADKGRMLWLGSAGYGLIYALSLPLCFRIHEHGPDGWSLGRVALEALAAGLLGLFALDAWAQLVGPIG